MRLNFQTPQKPEFWKVKNLDVCTYNMVEMSTRSNAQSTEVGLVGHENDHPDVVNLSECCENALEPEEDVDEDEDVDFNPFLKEAPSPEASSSLSSEVEVLDSDVVGSGGINIKSTGSDLLKLTSKVQDFEIAESEHGEDGVVTQTTDSPRGPCEKEYQKIVPRKSKKRKSVLTSRQEIESVREKEIGSSSGTDINDVVDGELDNTTHSWKPIMNLDDNDAICMRTRARYSLASFTLDELETFLQETDDEDDLQNVDDEEEYRKFLAAVLCGDGDVQTIQGNENHDEEDEDNDADFEIEIEEALGSDTDVNARDKSHKEYGGAGRRPETRQNKRQKSSSLCKNKNSELTKRPLRPILPILSNVAIAALPTLRGKSLMNETAPRHLSSTAKDGLVNGFTPHQIGQLYCLIHEHVQLLIQIFSICVLDPSRKHIASQVQGLIFEMLHKRDNVLAHKSEPYSGFCFCPPYICPSVPDKFPKIFPAQCSLDASPTFDAQRGSLLPNNEMPASHITSPSKGRCEYVSDGQVGSFQTTDSYFWVPFISSPILSILAVAPLNLVERYMDDVSTAVQEYQQHHLRSTCDTPLEREPLFPFPWFSHTEANVESSGGTIPPAANRAPSSPSQQPSKKTLAAALVERTKKQSVAFVPKQIAQLTQRFLPLFNPALYPHKPPPLAVANRVLFTDTEDELLALGLMEYNTDWKAIQQRFLPCKSKHQIFVRQKNRCSSKAPENPIKAVRRLKTSPLSAEEIARIQEGLRVFKFDWMSVWKLAVPHRDPSLLPRQWRIAHGTQKSYKHSAEQKEKRRLYEASRRKCKAADLENWETGSGKEGYQTANTSRETNGGTDYRDNKGEAYVNEGFLSNSRVDATNSISTELPSSDGRENNLPSSILPQEGPYISGQSNTCGPGESQSQNCYVHEFPVNSANTQHQHISSNSNCVRQSKCNIVEPNFTSSAVMPNTSKSQFCWLPYRARKNNSARLVKLSPDLPPVNLPSSVYVISQSAFKSYQCGASTKLSGAGGGSTSAGIENIVPRIPNVAKSKISHSLIAGQSKSNQLKENVSNSCPQESKDFEDTCTAEERGTESDLHMHPLLFQAPEDGRLPYYPINCSTSNHSSFSFFSGNQPHLTLSLFHNPYQANSTITCFNKSLELNEPTSRSCGIDFHPLLQRSEDMNTNLIESRGNCGPSSTRTIPSGPSEKANELDLEIHLSSTSRNEKLVGGKDVNAHNLTRSKIGAQGSRTIVETQKTNSLCFRQGENCPTVSSELISDACSVGTLSNNVKRHSMDDIGDQSHPEIVMEQEELSDSDEEEHVEFECEEMDDSEGGEESGCEQIAEMLNRVPLEAPNSTVEKVATDSNGDDQQLESRTNGLPQDSVFISRKGDTPLNLGLTSQGKDATSRSSWLSLDLSVPSHPPLTKPKHLGSTIGEGSAAKILTSTRPNRSCKKTKPSANEGTGQKHSMDFLQQHSMGPLAVPPVRKPRKRACRANTSLKIGMTIESSGCDDNVDCCTANTSEC